MKKAFTFFLLFFNLFVFSQDSKIKKSEVLPKDIEFKGHVKKITITDFISNNHNNKVDSIRAISEINFSKKGKMELVKTYKSFYRNYWEFIELDKLERIIKISFKRGDSLNNPIKQHYSNDSEFPDSTLINTYTKYKEKCINIFDKKKVVRQEYYVNDTLQDSRVYKYNPRGQMIEDLYLNPENESGETLISKETSNGMMLSFYPERKIMYEYERRKDTTVTIKFRPEYNIKEVTKNIDKPKSRILIFEKYDNNHLVEKEITRTFKDSISKIHLRYNEKGEVKSYYNTFTTPEKITTKYTLSENEKESLFIVNIEILYDRFKNWIKKTYIIRDQIESITERNIEYYHN